MGCGASASIAAERAAKRMVTQAYTITVHDTISDRRQDLEAWSWEPVHCLFERLPAAPICSICTVLLGDAAVDVDASFEQVGVCDASVLSLCYTPGFEAELDIGGSVTVYGKELAGDLLLRIKSQHREYIVDWSNRVTALDSVEQLWGEYHQQRAKMLPLPTGQTCEEAGLKDGCMLAVRPPWCAVLQETEWLWLADGIKTDGATFKFRKNGAMSKADKGRNTKSKSWKASAWVVRGEGTGGLPYVDATNIGGSNPGITAKLYLNAELTILECAGNAARAVRRGNAFDPLKHLRNASNA